MGNDELRPWAGQWVIDLTRLTLSTYGTRCHLCAIAEPPANTADHIIPRSLGGEDTIENLRPAHLSCNASRGNRPLSELVKPENSESFFKK